VEAAMDMHGKVWKFEANINTDLILPTHSAYLPPEEQVRFIFSANRPGWVDEMSPGDIIVSATNFGMGSSRPAARNLRILGVGCLVAESINGLFYRNSINFGLPVLECPGVVEAFEEGDTAEVSFEDFTVRNARSGETLQAKPVPDSLLRILKAGGIYPLLEEEGLIAPLAAEK
jgi:3-isopropylmalate/(R)-2-methylmalate dehydratase small subunit